MGAGFHGGWRRRDTGRHRSVLSVELTATQVGKSRWRESNLEASIAAIGRSPSGRTRGRVGSRCHHLPHRTTGRSRRSPSASLTGGQQPPRAPQIRHGRAPPATEPMGRSRATTWSNRHRRTGVKHLDVFEVRSTVRYSTVHHRADIICGRPSDNC